MQDLVGNHLCKIDAKGRVMFPARWRKQLEEVLHQGLYLSKNIFENCITVYTYPEWKKITSELESLSPFSKHGTEFSRRLNENTADVELDSAGRILIPQFLMEWAKIDLKKNNELLFLGLGGRMELWVKEVREERRRKEQELDMETLAELARKEIRESKAEGRK
jgi:MraZ protein